MATDEQRELETQLRQLELHQRKENAPPKMIEILINCKREGRNPTEEEAEYLDNEARKKMLAGGPENFANRFVFAILEREYQARQSIRNQKLCPNCGYDLRGIEGDCPKCAPSDYAKELQQARIAPLGKS